MQELTIKQLETTTNSYKEDTDFYKYLQALLSGGRNILPYKQLLIPQRITEQLAPYQKRLQQFVYTPVISSAIEELLNRFNQGSIYITGISDTLNTLREYLYQNQDEISFLKEILERLLTWGSLYVLIKFGAVKDCGYEYTPSLVDQLNSGYAPSLQFIDPLNILLYTKDFCKLRFIEEVVGYDGSTSFVYTWVIMDNTYIATYTHRTNKPLTRADNNISITPEITQHGQGSIPLKKFELPGICLAEKLYPKQEQYTRLENGLNAGAYAANTIQKVITPIKEDTNVLIDDDYLDSVDIGNEYLIKAEKFEFVEVKGDSLRVQLDLLRAIEASIKQLACLSGLSFTDKPLANVSGVSKEFEFSAQEASLCAYGKIICGIYQQLLNHIQTLYNEPATVCVHGLDDFSLDSLEDTVSQLVSVQPVKGELSPTAYKKLLLKAATLLAEGSSKEDLQLITQEVYSATTTSL